LEKVGMFYNCSFCSDSCTPKLKRWTFYEKTTLVKKIEKFSHNLGKPIEKRK
jgi:hypothetical protein